MKIRESTQSYLNIIRRGERGSALRSLRKRVVQVFNYGSFKFLLGFITFAVVGAAIEYYLEGRNEESIFSSFFDSLWFTIVTITTVGYGDISPVTPLGKTWAMMEMFVGIGLVGIITGNVASFLVERSRNKALGLGKLGNLKGHAIICGWKREMKEILLGVLGANPGLDSSDLVLVTTAPATEISDLRRDSRLRNLHYIFGSHTDRNVLTQAGIATADRVLILAVTNGGQSADQVDSRTVLAAATVETLNSKVFTCAEILQPHYIHYLRHARVEEVVLNEENVRRLIVAGSLGEGMGNVLTQFFPEYGRMLRPVPVPDHCIGRPYSEVEAEFRAQGFLVSGFLENTGNLHERKQEKLRVALKAPDYKRSVASLAHMTRLQSNLSHLIPPPDAIVPEHSEMLIVLPSGTVQSEEESARRREQAPQPRSTAPEKLLVSGWKPDMANLLKDIINLHKMRGRDLTEVTVVAPLPADEAQAIADHPVLSAVRLIEGEATDPDVLRQAGIQETNRVLVLASPAPDQSPQETDSRNVMTCIAIHGLNRKVYKCVEVLDPNFGEHLKIADVEEVIYSLRFQQVMLAESSSGSGLSHAIRDMLDPETAPLRVIDLPSGPPGMSFEEHRVELAQKGFALLGVVEHSGNHHARKQEFLYAAQIQPKIQGAIERLVGLKQLEFNKPIFNPGRDFLPGDRSLAVVMAGQPSHAPT